MAEIELLTAFQLNTLELHKNVSFITYSDKGDIFMQP